MLVSRDSCRYRGRQGRQKASIRGWLKIGGQLTETDRMEPRFGSPWIDASCGCAAQKAELSGLTTFALRQDRSDRLSVADRHWAADRRVVHVVEVDPQRLVDRRVDVGDTDGVGKIGGHFFTLGIGLA